MKNNKILENRPELTNEQIKKGMDFNKIKNNAVIAKSAVLKSHIITGFWGFITISSIVLIYKIYNSPFTEKTQTIFIDTTKTNSATKKDVPTIYTKTTIDKKIANLVEPKSTLNNNTVAVLHLTKDTNVISTSTVQNIETSKNTNHIKSDVDFDDEETNDINKINQFTKAFGQDDIKELNKSFAKINNRLYASKYEVSNKLYMIFLNSLKQSNNKSLLAIAQIDTLKWLNKVPAIINESYVHYYHSHPAYQSYPVVNISYEAAKLFCEWLTVQYNSHPKRKFKKVLFRLPSEKEWIEAAQAGDSSAVYPWQGNELRNKKGQIVCNFRREKGIKDTIVINVKHFDNVDITTPITQYWPNKLGLYNMGGNVAEMVNEKGITKGGSWRDNANYLKNDAKYKYDGNAQPFVGFRYFMEILEK